MAGGHALFLAPLLVSVAAAAAAVAPVSDAAMRDETDRLAAEVGAVRKIPLRGTLERHLVTRDEARAEIDAAVTATLAGSEMATEERVLQRLGLLPAGSDYARLLSDAVGATPAGYYDAGSHRLYVPDWIPLDRQRLTLAHEIAHAVADQRFGLRQTLQVGADGRHRLGGDAERARQALIEGDAMTVALEVEDPRGAFLGTRELPALAERLRAAAIPAVDRHRPAPPPIIGEVARFTHVDGLLFVARLRRTASWSAVDAVWADPPQSTEQILHPEKYDAHESPLQIETTPLAALEPAFHAGGSAVLGELVIRTWLETACSPEVAARAAAGWAGDRAVLYLPPTDQPPDAGPPPDPALAWLTIWDDPVDAADFARAAVVVLTSLQARGPGLFTVAARGDKVALLLGAPAGSESALDEMIDGWRRVVPGKQKTARSAKDARRAKPDQK